MNREEMIQDQYEEQMNQRQDYEHECNLVRDLDYCLEEFGIEDIREEISELLKSVNKYEHELSWRELKRIL